MGIGSLAMWQIDGVVWGETGEVTAARPVVSCTAMGTGEPSISELTPLW